jgi:hypothetical protein
MDANWIPMALTPVFITLILQMLRKLFPPPENPAWSYDQRQVPEPFPPGLSAALCGLSHFS